MPGALDQVEARGARRPLEQPAAVGGGHDLVPVAVEDERRDVDASNLRFVVHLGADQEARNEPIVLASQRRHRAERRFEHDGGNRSLERNFDRHGPTQRPAEQDDIFRPHGPGRHRVVDGQTVEIDALLVGCALTPTVTAVVHEHDIDAEFVHEPPGVVQPVPDVPGVAVVPDEHPVSGTVNPPPMKQHPVGGRDRQLVRAKSEVRRQGGQRLRRKEDETPLLHHEQAYEQEPGDRHERQERQCSPDHPSETHLRGILAAVRIDAGP